MQIKENEANRNDIPPFEVINQEGDVVYYAMTLKECEIYIISNS